jgi:ligand-binding sensor domain-containing protein
MKKYTWIILLIIIGSFSLTSQSNIPIGAWKSYLPYKDGRLVTQSDDKIIYATNFSVMTIGKEDFLIETLSKVDGFNDISVSQMAYNDNLDQLVLSYDNNNIDIVEEDEVINVPDIKQNTNIQGDTRINDIYISLNDKAYFSAGFGIVEYDLSRLEFGFTTFTELVVTESTILNDKLYIATEDGAYYIELSANINQGDFNKWEIIGSDNGLPDVYDAAAIATKNNSIYLATDDALYRSDSDGLQFTKIADNNFTDFTTAFLSEETTDLAWGFNNGQTFRSKIRYFKEDDSSFENTNYCGLVTNFVIEDQNGLYWYADEAPDFRYSESVTADCKFITVNGPNSNKVSDMDIRDNSIYVASGGVSETFGYLFGRDGFYILEDGQWDNVNRNTFPELEEKGIQMLNQIEAHPSNDKIYIGSYYAGIVEYDPETKEAVFTDKDNSCLDGTVGDEQRTRITGLAFDSDENLWVSNFDALNPLVVFDPEGTCYNFAVSSANRVTDIAIDDNDYKWVIVDGNNGGVYVLDSGEDLASPMDDRRFFFNINNSVLATNAVNCAKVDLNGDVWIGSGEGPVVFECGSSIFDGSCQGSRRSVLEDSIRAFLLETEDIRAIEVDGANRKWFGTRNGVFVQSPDGETQIHNFTTTNSPLPDNTITALRFNDETGEMFIATNNGIISYRTETLGAKRTHANQVYSFPNPVRPDYEGPIAIKGLAQNANVKITDINGRLVYETDALGGQAIWDGRDYNGRKASTGVYLVFSATSDSFFDPDSFVTKIMLVE